MTINRVELGYNVIKGTEYFVSLQTSVVLTEEYDITVNNGALIGNTECLTLWARCRINRCCYNWVWLYYGIPKREAKTLATNDSQTEMTLQLWRRKLIFVFLFLFLLFSVMALEIFCNANRFET